MTATREAPKELRRHEKDTGSTEVQIALLHERIRKMTEHFKGHPKDRGSKRGLALTIGKFNAMLKYLQRRDPARYQAVAQKLDLRR